MVERQDIDALLIGALYGELTPADEARLTTHLESHPTDRSALDGLKSAREAVRESRIFQLQLDPPQAVSAMLLQEAARRAPKLVVQDHDHDKSESWFARFVRSFVAHPAMAAAAMFVVVVGVAGTIYMKQGTEQVADQSIDRSVAVGSPAAAPTPPVADPSARAAAAGSATSNYAVALDEGQNTAGDQEHAGKLEQSTPKPVVAVTHHESLRNFETAKAKATDSYVAVHTADRTPKDLPEAKGTISMADSQQKEREEMSPATQPATGGGAVATTPSQGQAGPTAAPPPPPAAPAMTATIARTSPPTENKDKSESAWAQGEHQRLVQLVSNGKCQDAAQIAVSIRNRAPDYYNAYVATDRKLKSCMQYITDAAEKDAERSSKSRPAKRADMNEVK